MITTVHLHATADEGRFVKPVLQLMSQAQMDLIMSGFDCHLHATEIDPSVPEVEEFHDDQTLQKVYEALMSVKGVSVQRAQDAVSAMQNAGILFRERR